MAKAKLPKHLMDSIKEINKKMGAGTILSGNTPIVNVEAIPTNIASLDIALGIRGLPRGRFVELFGVESSGKTTTALQFIKACQQQQVKNRTGIAAFIDAEHAFDPEWAENIGVDLDALLIHQPEHGEQAFTITEALCSTGDVDLIVIDSLAALVPKEELDGDIEDKQMGAQARMVSKGLRRIKGLVSNSGTVIVFINQIRNKVGVMFGSPEQTPGGLALKFYASIRIDMRKAAAVKEAGKGGDDDEKGWAGAIGARTRVKVVKNKLARPFLSCEYSIYFGTSPVPGAPPIYGIDTVGSLFDQAMEADLITLSGNNYYLNDFPKGDDKSPLGIGKVKAYQALREAQYLPQLREAVLHKLLPKDNTAPEVPEAAEAPEGDEPKLDEEDLSAAGLVPTE